MKEEYLNQLIKDIRELKKKTHKLNVKFKRKIKTLETENEILKEKLDRCERELGWCKKYDMYYDD